MFRVSAKNLFLFAQKRFLQTSAALLKPPISPPPPPPPPPPSSSSLVDCLVKSLGLPLESAVSISQEVGAPRNGLAKADSVLRFLRSRGFDEAQMAKFVTNGPSLLLLKVESNLKPKLDYFREIGLSESFLLGASRKFFGRSLNSYYKPQIDFLKKYLRTSNALNVAIKRCHWLLTVDRKHFLEPNIDLLMREGVRFDDIGVLMLYQPRTLVLKVEKMAAIVESVKGLGMEPSSANFIHGVRVMSSMKESNWNKKVDNFKSLGWSQEEILSMFVSSPHCFSLSEEKIRRTMDFYLNTASISREFIVSRPHLLYYSVDKRLWPRHSVITVLSAKGLLKKGKSVVAPYRLTEEVFLKRYVMKHAEQVPHLMEIYRASASFTKENSVENQGVSN